MHKGRKRLNELLLDYNLIDAKDVSRALALHHKKGGQLATILVEEGFVKEEDIVNCFCRYLNIPPINLSKFKGREEIIKIIPEHVARHYRLICVSQTGNMLTVAMSDPLNVLAIDDIKALTGYDITPVVAPLNDISTAIDRFYHHKEEAKASGSLGDLVKEISDEDIQIVKEQEQIDIGEVIRSSSEAPIVKMIDALIAEALIKRASDIHIEPYETDIRIRYRIDGSLSEAVRLPKKVQNAITARLKIMSNMDITQRLIPQDGRFKVKLEEKEVDFRVSVLPISFGEKVVMRALDKANLSIGLEVLGFLPEALDAFQYAVSRPYGMILVTGPTGSGKSTTLYSVLNKLNLPERNIITVEDPVEYQVEGITQVQVKPDIGLNFSQALRSILRQNPDVLMVGEIRDFETADIAVKAALTGALLLSTLHTNDAPGAITRLIDMGVEPFLIASSIIAVAAQRLARKICPDCKEPYKVPQSVLDRLELHLDSSEVTVYRGRGCGKCGKSGYRGRFALLEIMVVNDEIRSMVMQRCSSDEIKRYARSKLHMSSLRDTGIKKFLDGQTTLEEVLRVTSKE
ncbi:MAG: Flp pilus assembly complex ATPase component TadA [Candidatus Omnitrophica bacterium]|nr:Flp pilus assembly complex ATPase component TadA [Candidatus Omnitrophota bacterium]MCG2704132.1 Flp pilus assembly complex ATPase component TadA [Candidatus Omnitrophota bacterium]